MINTPYSPEKESICKSKMKLFYIFLSIIIVASCSHNEFKYVDLVGNWKLDTVIDSSGVEKDFYFISKPGLEFISTSQFRYLPGPVDLSREEQPKLKELIDTIINFNIMNNQIVYQSLKNNESITKEILRLTLDSLYVLDNKKNLHKYFRIYADSTNQNSINKIVLSSTGCYGVCPIIDIEINESKEASFYCTAYCGDEGFHKGEMPKSKIDRLFQFFNFINIDTLDNSYSANHTDDETITVSFYNDNKHLKTVSDYGRKAPSEFIWLYTYLRYMPGLKDLKLNYETTNSLNKSSCYVFSNGEEGYSFEKSESYMIYTQLLNAKVINEKTVLPYEIYDLSFPVQKLEGFIEYNGKPKVIGHTNGRFFKFKSINNQIIDLGYNCLTMKEQIK
jgi:hypothetical protein